MADYSVYPTQRRAGLLSHRRRRFSDRKLPVIFLHPLNSQHPLTCGTRTAPLLRQPELHPFTGRVATLTDFLVRGLVARRRRAFQSLKTSSGGIGRNVDAYFLLISSD